MHFHLLYNLSGDMLVHVLFYFGYGNLLQRVNDDVIVIGHNHETVQQESKFLSVEFEILDHNQGILFSQ